MRGVSRERQARRLASMRKMAEDIANGNGPLDRVEQFCRERGICHYCDFIDRVMAEDEDLARWALKDGRGVAARTRGINARIAKVKREVEGKLGKGRI